MIKSMRSRRDQDAHVERGNVQVGDFGFTGWSIRIELSSRGRRFGVSTFTGTNLDAVEIVAMYGGADGRLIKAAVDQGQGIVVQASAGVT